MKHPLLILFVLTSLAFSACRKGERLFDKRNKLTGKFEMTVERYDWGYYSSSTYKGEVSYSRKEQKDDEIVIRYSDNESYTLIVDDHKNLTLRDCDNVVGAFSSNDKKFNLEIFANNACGENTGLSKKVKITAKRK